MMTSLADAATVTPEETPLVPIVPRLTTTPGIGGVIKQRSEDFIVTEVPSGDLPVGGEHMWVKIRATGVPHGMMMRAVQKACGVQRSAVGYLGIKDTHAVTTQTVSVHHPNQELSPGPLRPGVEVLEVGRTARKLRPGGCANAFVIRIREVDSNAESVTSQTLEVLRRHGLPNAFGPQRFGVRSVNHLLGRDLLLGQFDVLIDRLLLPACGEESIRWRAEYAAGDVKAALHHGVDAMGARGESELPALRTLAKGKGIPAAVAAIPRSIKRFWVDALQSAIFNGVLAARITEGTSGALLLGDVPHDRGDGRMMQVIGDADRLLSLRDRHDHGEIVGTGPLWSPTMRVATHHPGEIEATAIKQWIGDPDGAAHSPMCPGGARRPFHHRIDDVHVTSISDEHGPAIEVRMTLPAGAYATTVLDEIMGNVTKE